MFTKEELEELQELKEFYYDEGVQLQIDNQHIDFFESVANIAWEHKDINEYTEQQLDHILLQIELYDDFWKSLEWFNSEPFHIIRMKFCTMIDDYRSKQHNIAIDS